MNSSVYAFGKDASGYTQFPDDSSAKTFKSFIEHSQAKTQLCIHRNGELMYYGYVRKLTNPNEIMGLCIVINGAMITQVAPLFSLFENTMEKMLRDGKLIHFTDKGNIELASSHMHHQSDYVTSVASMLKLSIERMRVISKRLPPINYAISQDKINSYVIEDNLDEITESSFAGGYTFVYKDHGFASQEVDYLANLISKLKKENNNLISKITQLKRQKRNTNWVISLAALTIILGIIVWFKVINPSEVTNKNFPEFNYYGQMQNMRPHGVGVAVYHEYDPDGRKYYIGHFVNGDRNDNKAMLLYDNGDFFYGEMEGDKWKNGIYYSNTDNTHFQGDFMDNEPFNGVWYEHTKASIMNNGIIK